MELFLLIGSPGSGKGTQAKLITQKDSTFIHVSTGDLLRSAILSHSQIGIEIKQIVESGKLVDDFLILNLMSDYCLSLPFDKKVLLDGYPRNISQVQLLDNIKEFSVKKVFYLKVPQEILIQRLSSRRVCTECNKVFNTISNPYVKDISCSEKKCNIIQRKDDTEEIIINRLKIFNNEISEVIKFYEEKKIVETIDADISINEITDKILDLLS